MLTLLSAYDYDAISSLVGCYLQSDSVLHQQTDLNVHRVQVFLHLLVGADLGDHFLPQTSHFLLLQQVQIALLQQVDKLTHHGEGGVLGAG